MRQAVIPDHPIDDAAATRCHRTAPPLLIWRNVGDPELFEQFERAHVVFPLICTHRNSPGWYIRNQASPTTRPPSKNVIPGQAPPREPAWPGIATHGHPASRRATAAGFSRRRSTSTAAANSLFLELFVGVVVIPAKELARTISGRGLRREPRLISHHVRDSRGQCAAVDIQRQVDRGRLLRHHDNSLCRL